jgi:ABC-type sugar transport system permease subunit
MLLITTGALQGIPSDMYEAAEVDGAGPMTKFWKLTLPLLLVAVGPLLIASFAFNFNNFTVIQLYLDGGPPISTTSVAGYTDILITYTYEVAFSSGQGADYGYATAITIVIFVLLSVVTIGNFQLTKRLEEIAENV